MESSRVINSRKIVAKNCAQSYEYDETSFAAILHERGIWQRDQYWLLERALYDLTSETEGREELCGSVFRIFSYVMNAISSHLDKDDLFEIQNLGRDEVYEFRERIRMVFEGFFLKNFPDQIMFEEENPLLPGGKGAL